MNSILETPKTSFSGPWIRMANPQLVSLAMIVHRCHDFFTVSEQLADEIMVLVHQGNSVPLEAPDLHRIIKVVDKSAMLAESMQGVSVSLRKQLRSIGNDLRKAKPNDPLMTPEVIQRDLEHIQGAFRAELEQHHFVYIPSAQSKYLRKPHLFGTVVNRKFPSAREDIKAAGTALAVELYAACIFHLMRVAEHGLRELARQLKVKLTDKSKGIPLEYGDWNKVITGIRSKIDAARKLPHGSNKEKELAMYSAAADHCEYMKDIWRNSISHARGLHVEADALQAMEHVRGFMQLLSANK